MKITHLAIKDKEYKNLNIDLKDNASGIMAFIGNNGSGKSNLLESLSIIFKKLYTKKDKEIPFSFSISYKNSGSTDIITITKQKTTIKYYVDKTDVNGNVERNVVSDVYNNLPKQIVAIYSGEENRLWKNWYKPIYDDFISNITSAKTTGIGSYNDFPKMLYINKFYWHISLLCLLLQRRYNESDTFCSDLLNIKEVHTVKFSFIKDNYKNYTNSNVKQFVETLDHKDEYTLDELNDIFFDKGYTIADAYKYLYIAYTPDKKKMVKDIVIKYNEDHLEIEHFSEGEKKMLLIKAALEFAGAEDSLFILDEPDAHIHLNNKIQIKKVFEKYVNNRQVILTTHSPTLTDTFDDDSLYMLNQGKLVPQAKQEILENVSGEFWNKFQQNAFLASRKPIILLVEGKHDKEHINNAYKALNEEYKDLDFEVFVLNGESKIHPFLSGLYESDFQTNCLYIGIYDNDQPGEKSFNNGYKKIEGKEFKNLIESNNKLNTSYFAFKLPKPDGITCECTIETMYDSDKFLDALNESYQIAKDHIKDKSIDDISKNIKEGAKNILASKSSTFAKEDFKHFRKIFGIIKDIDTYRKKLIDKTTVDTTNVIKVDIQEQPDSTRNANVEEETKHFLEIYTTAKEVEAKGEYYPPNKIIVKAGSSIMQKVTPSFTGKEERNKLIRKHIDKSTGEWILKNDIEFKTPSGAIKFVMGSNLNGWKYWHLSKNNEPLQTIRN